MTSSAVLLLVISCVACVRALDDPPRKGVTDWYGIDVQVPDPNSTDADAPKRSVRLKAFPGNNLTNLALQFFDDHVKKYNASDVDFVVNHLENAAGGKCDACKTFVEMLTDRFISMGIKFAKVDGHDQTGKPLKSMHISQEKESYIGSVCKVDDYNSFAPHIRQGCWDILSAKNSRSIFNFFNNGTLGPDTVVARKSAICQQHLNHCVDKPALPPGKTPVPLGKCRACAEVVEDLDFLLRRSSRRAVSASDQYSRKKAAKAGIKDRYLSTRHISRSVEELCGSLELMHPPSVLDELTEYCENMVEESREELVEAFKVDEFGHRRGHPGVKVCVQATSDCDGEEEYWPLWPRLESYAYNFTHYRNLPEPTVEKPSVDAKEPASETDAKEGEKPTDAKEPATAPSEGKPAGAHTEL